MNRDHQILQTSILDRLIDEEPGVSREPAQHRTFTIGQVKAAVTRDLENLLNTRRNIQVPPATFEELNNSLFVYGVRDYTAQNPRSPAAKRQLRLDLEQTLMRFEPRLRNVTVQVEPSTTSGSPEIFCVYPGTNSPENPASPPAATSSSACRSAKERKPSITPMA